MQQLIKYLKYKLTAKHRKGYSIHSPFLYDLIRNVICKKTNYYALDDIAQLRYELLSCNETIEVIDFGAGSKVFKSNIRKIKDIAKYSAINEKFGEMMFRLIDYFKPQTVLELGTSLGIGTSYLAMPNSKAQVYTIEACPETAKKTSENFEELNINNIHQIIGNINDELPGLLNNIDKLDFVYFDGNHQKEASLNYYNQCLQKAHNDTIFYFDDIHWSKGMEEAWEEIKANKDVTLTVDLFFSGIVFFKKELSKEDFIVRF
ncbi:MAG: class I SAM-dependent methyltransferase [Bacteroidales bacterium]|nr:class I SAM-dependent methyltransferase [Bacteroidales bacterium]